MKHKVCSKDIKLENGQILKTDYYVISEYNEELNLDTYGVIVEIPARKEISEVKDIFVSKNEAVEFILKISDSDVTPVSLHDIVDDLIYA